MKRLLTIEWYKLRGYSVAWVMVALFAGLGFLLYFWFAQTRDELVPAGSGLEQFFPLYRFPDIWQFLPFIVTNFANAFLGILILILVGNELQYKTLRQSVIHGLSRTEAWATKAYLVIVLAAGATVLLFLMGLLFGYGFGGGDHAAPPYVHIDFLLGYFLSTCGFLFAALWLGLALQRSGLAIGLYVFWVLMMEPMISSMVFNLLIEDGVGDYLPFTAFKSVYGMSFMTMLEPSKVTSILNPFTFATIGYTGLFAWHSWYLVRKGSL